MQIRDNVMKKLILILLALGIYNTNGSIIAQEAKSNNTANISTQTAEEQLEITASGNQIKVTNAPVGSMLEIYSVVGIKVKEIEMKEPSGQYTVNIAKGYYIIRIGEVARKIIIR